MSRIESHYLPLGSIVSLRDGNKRVMIYGRIQQIVTGIEYDYLACLYPDGFLSPTESVLFNHDDIAEIHHIGYADGEEALIQSIIQRYRPLTAESLDE